MRVLSTEVEMAPFIWSKENTEELILAYEENYILWDTKNKEYRNREKKNKILQEISIKFSCTSEEVQRKLHNLRNQVSQELKKIKKKCSGDGTDDNYISNWPYFKSLQFLVPVLTVNQTLSSMTTTTLASLDTQLTEPIINEVETELKEQTPNTATSLIIDKENEIVDAEPKRKRKRPLTKRTNEDDEDDKVYKKALETLRKEPDADDRFGEYVAMELKGLRSAYNKHRMKSEIRKIVARIVDEDDMHYFSNSSSTTTPTPSPGFWIQPVDALCKPLSPVTQQLQSDAGESSQPCHDLLF